ncbi:NAD-dependent epimerase/dehydratase family protein [Paenibacillus sp. GCM10012306]|uniref:NAD-dependent epimerase/dehydratase family protein n=1 Tax=Paenibacillus sp. GCM10012306 TaxID=3317342 RepID=UPI00360EB7D6
MRNILVLGGTRFFGKRLVERLLEDKYCEVTIVTRGETADSFGDRVHRVHVNRRDQAALADAVGDREWDVVYDNICFSPNDAAAACDIFDGKAKRYILTSSLSVYDFSDQTITEGDFDAATYPLQYGEAEDFSYKEGKRLAEAVLIQRATFPVAAVRIPIVLGTDDYTRRLHFHIEHIRKGIPIAIDPEPRMSFIRSNEAADFLYWLGGSDITGPVNACSNGTLRMGELLGMIETVVGQKAVIVEEAQPEHSSPFYIPKPWFMDTTKARSAGYSFLDLATWMPELIAMLNRSYE